MASYGGKESLSEVTGLAGPVMLSKDERLHSIYYSVLRATVLTRGIPVTMEDPRPEGNMEPQDSSKERSTRSPGGDICECCWPEGGVLELTLALRISTAFQCPRLYKDLPAGRDYDKWLLSCPTRNCHSPPLPLLCSDVLTLLCPCQFEWATVHRNRVASREAWGGRCEWERLGTMRSPKVPVPTLPQTFSATWAWVTLSKEGATTQVTWLYWGLVAGKGKVSC